MADGQDPAGYAPDQDWQLPVGGLIGNSLFKAHQRLTEKHKEAYRGLMESLAGVLAPDASKFQANAIQDFDVYLNQLLPGSDYKEHSPTIMGVLRNVGNAILGMGGGQLPQKHMVMPGMARDPQTGQPIQAGLPQAGALGSQGVPGQPAPAAPTQGPGISYSPVAGYTPVSPSTLTAAQAQQGVQGPLPGGSTPASTLAPPTTQGGVSPLTLATGQPMTRADQLKAGGRLLNEKDPNSPIVMPLPQDVIRSGDVNVLKQRGAFGKTAQQTQEIINDFALAVQQGFMTTDEAREGIKKALMAEADPTRPSTATGTDRKTYIQFPARPAQRDPVTGEMRPAQEASTEIYGINSKTGLLTHHGRDVPWSEIEARGGKEVDKAPAPYRTQGTLPGTAREVVEAFAAHPEWGQPNPNWQYRATWQHDPQNPEAPPRLVQMTPQATNQMNDRLFNRNYQIAQNLYPTQANGQPSTPQQWARAAALMTQRQEAVQMAGQQQRQGVQERLYNVPSGQGLLLTPQEAQSIGVTQSPAAQVPDWVSNPTEQNINQFLGQGAPGGAAAPGAAAPGGGFPGGGPGTAAMQGLEPAPAATTPVPTPAPAPTPAPQGGPPAGEKPPAAGFPPAPPRPQAQPQAPQAVAPAPQAAAPPQVAAAPVPQQQPAPQPTPPSQQVIGQALPGGQQYNALGVPIIPREQKRNTQLQSYIASITPGTTQTQADKMNASDGATLIAAENKISLGDLYIAGVKWVANADALKQRINQRNNMMRFVDQLKAFTDAWLEVQRKVPDAGSILGNAFDRNAINMIASDPRLAAAQASAAPMMRAWNAITSNAYLSSGALPEGSRLDIAQLFQHGNLTMPQAYAIAKRLDVEADIEMWSFDKSVWNNTKEMADNPIGRSLGSKAGDPPKFPASAGPRPRDGQPVKGPDGTWYRYSEAHDSYIPDQKLNQERKKK